LKARHDIVDGDVGDQCYRTVTGELVGCRLVVQNGIGVELELSYDVVQRYVGIVKALTYNQLVQ